MAIVLAKCPGCGATLRVDSAKDAAICPTCRNPFVVQKAIDLYNAASGSVRGTVSSGSNDPADFVIRAGTLEKYIGSPTRVVIPNNVTSIGDSAFKGCKGLISVTIPGTVKSIERGAFLDCTGLTSVTIANGVKSIEDYAFHGCTSLTSVTIPISVTRIGHHVFSGCTAMKNLYLTNSHSRRSIGGLFSGCEWLTSVTLPNSLTSIEERAFWGCTGLTKVTIPNSVTSIGDSAFEGCKSLASVTIPNSVTSIGGGAFSNCTSMTGVTIPNSVTSIGGGAFSNCTSLTSVTIPNSVTSTGVLFPCCPNLVTVKKPTHISDESFYGSPWYRNKKQSKNNGGCYVATAVYGSYDCPEVWVLRRFRDQSLASTRLGRLFIACYYAVSPAVVRRFGSAAWFNRLWKARLDRLVKKLKGQGFADTPYQDAPRQ